MLAVVIAVLVALGLQVFLLLWTVTPAPLAILLGLLVAGAIIGGTHVVTERRKAQRKARRQRRFDDTGAAPGAPADRPVSQDTPPASFQSLQRETA